MKISYLHILPLEYYPPACNYLNLIGCSEDAEIRVYTMQNLKNRKTYDNRSVDIRRTVAPDPGSNPLRRLLVAFWWHLRTAMSLSGFKPEALIYVEPHSAIAAWIYYKVFRGKAKLFIHHHEYYEPKDFNLPGMRLPRIGSQLERSHLFNRADWISQTNADRLRLAKKDHPEVPDKSWHILSNYPPVNWADWPNIGNRERGRLPLRLVYVGSASFVDTYIEEIVRWVSSHPSTVELHICGYNVAREVWDWLEKEQFANVTFDSEGYAYEELPRILDDFDIGLVLYKGNTTNFVYNVPNKVFEYLVCGLNVWFPREMKGIQNFCSQYSLSLRELDFADLDNLHPGSLQPADRTWFDNLNFTAEQAFAPMFAALGVSDRAIPR